LSFPTRASGADWIVVICLCLIALLIVIWCGLVLAKSMQDRAWTTPPRSAASPDL
jgi:hypothetical protein